MPLSEVGSVGVVEVPGAVALDGSDGFFLGESFAVAPFDVLA